MKKLIILITIACSLQGCFFVAGAAAGAAAIAVVYDNRKIEKALQDEKIAKNVSDKIDMYKNIRDNSNIHVTCFNQVILLTGQASNKAIIDQAYDVARTIPDIKRIYNQITVKGRSSTLTQASDTWITTKVKSNLLATKGLKSGSIKVVTENGSVYLMGTVTREQADTVVNVVRQVKGVQRVMKIFQYTD